VNSDPATFDEGTWHLSESPQVACHFNIIVLPQHVTDQQELDVTGSHDLDVTESHDLHDTESHDLRYAESHDLRDTEDATDSVKSSGLKITTGPSEEDATGPEGSAEQRGGMALDPQKAVVYALTNLMPAQQYTFRVASATGAGEGPYSLMINGTTSEEGELILSA
jgi:hypothetical protein